MNIAVVILWYLIGYVGCIWTFSRHWDVASSDLIIFLFLAIGGPLFPFLVFICMLKSSEDKVVIRRRK